MLHRRRNILEPLELLLNEKVYKEIRQKLAAE